MVFDDDLTVFVPPPVMIVSFVSVPLAVTSPVQEPAGICEDGTLPELSREAYPLICHFSLVSCFQEINDVTDDGTGRLSNVAYLNA